MAQVRGSCSSTTEPALRVERRSALQLRGQPLSVMRATSRAPCAKPQVVGRSGGGVGLADADSCTATGTATPRETPVALSGVEPEELIRGERAVQEATTAKAAASGRSRSIARLARVERTTSYRVWLMRDGRPVPRADLLLVFIARSRSAASRGGTSFAAIVAPSVRTRTAIPVARTRVPGVRAVRSAGDSNSASRCSPTNY
jgi:hypothetical protein